MAKRFIETTIWTQNKWFRKLEVHYKVLWFYLISSCDPVGVWEEDLELCSFIIGYEYSMDSLLKVYEGKIKKINAKKYWIIDFCHFQYGELRDDSKNKPHQSYISLLKKHNLWIEYLKTIDSLKEKEKDKEKEEDKEKDTFIGNRKQFIENVKKEATELNFDESIWKPFCDFWTDIDITSKLMQWQTRESFAIHSRLKTWNKLSKSGNENWKEKLIEERL